LKRQIIRASACKNVKSDREGKEDYRGDPPDHPDPCRFQPGTKFAPSELVVIEVVVGQIEAVMEVGINAPSGIVIRTANWAGQSLSRDVLAADGADVGRFECRPGHFRVKLRKRRFETVNLKAGTTFSRSRGI
jgi:hypothetical protein